MAHFVKVKKNKVIDSIVIHNDDIYNEEFPKSEPMGQHYIKSIGLKGHWLQTSYNGNFRNCYGGIGYTYNSELDVFIMPKPYPSWTLNSSTIEWEAPTPSPTPNNDNEYYVWNEGTQQWDLEYEGVSTETTVRVDEPFVNPKISVYEGAQED